MLACAHILQSAGRKLAIKIVKDRYLLYSVLPAHPYRLSSVSTGINVTTHFFNCLVGLIEPKDQNKPDAIQTSGEGHCIDCSCYFCRRELPVPAKSPARFCFRPSRSDQNSQKNDCRHRMRNRLQQLIHFHWHYGSWVKIRLSMRILERHHSYVTFCVASVIY
jgi:hypothetical protein